MTRTPETLQLVRNIGSTLVTRAVTIVLALLSSIVLARVLGPEGRGSFALVMILPSLAGTIGLLGFEQANAVYAGLEPLRRRALAWQSAAVAAGMGGALAAAGAIYFLAGAPGLEALASAPSTFVFLLLATIPAQFVLLYWSAIIRGMNRIQPMNLLEVGTRVAGLAGIVVFVWGLDFGVAGVVWLEVAMTLGAAIVVGVLLWTAGGLGLPVWDAGLWRRVTTFALPVHMGTIAAYLNYRVDEIFIATLLPTEQLGVYVIAVALVERIWILPGSVSAVLLPHLTSSRERDASVVAAICRHVAMWTGAACVILLVAAGPLVALLYSSKFAGAVAPLRWLLPGIFTLSIGKILVGELLAREKARYTVWASGAAVVTNIAGNLLLVPQMGIVGAALASSVSYSVLSGVLTWYYLRVTGTRWTSLVPRVEDLSAYRSLWCRVFRRHVTSQESVMGRGAAK